MTERTPERIRFKFRTTIPTYVNLPDPPHIIAHHVPEHSVNNGDICLQYDARFNEQWNHLRAAMAFLHYHNIKAIPQHVVTVTDFEVEWLVEEGEEWTDFRRHCNDASAHVESWPRWKQSILRNSLRPTRENDDD